MLKYEVELKLNKQKSQSDDLISQNTSQIMKEKEELTHSLNKSKSDNEIISKRLEEMAETNKIMKEENEEALVVLEEQDKNIEEKENQLMKLNIELSQASLALKETAEKPKVETGCQTDNLVVQKIETASQTVKQVPIDEEVQTDPIKSKQALTQTETIQSKEGVTQTIET